MRVSAPETISDRQRIEWENVDFLMSPEGGGLELQQVARRLGVGLEGLKKRITARRKMMHEARGG